MPTAIGSYATAALLKAQTGIPDTTDDAVLGAVCDRINAFIEGYTRRILAPIASATYAFDVEEPTRRLDVTQHASGFVGGLRAISLLEVAPHTGAPYSTLPASDYFLRDVSMPAAPFDRVVLSDVPSGGYSRFPRGLATVRITATAGWAVIPDDIIEVALTAATRAWHAIQSGQTDMVGTDEMGQTLVSRSFSPRDLDTLMRYRRGRDRA